jgi:GTP-binding protein HflX
VLPGAGLARQRLEESRGLCEALGVSLAFAERVNVRDPHPARLFGAGQIASLKDRLGEAGATLLIVDGQLTPVQQRNLERDLGIKVIDRTGLILEIFGLRARTAEGRLQVEMARSLYERSRLVRTWTHLERQRGGFGFLGGPGETQLEADRRMLDKRIAGLRGDLEDIRRTRRLQREGRVRRGSPVIALIGYTNAGKSTLFNLLTHADVLAADMPFATLDPTTRDIEVAPGRRASLIDTVGFITDLPTHLVAAFRATLEEAMEADLLLHVRDIAHEDTEGQAEDVYAVLRQLEEAAGHAPPPIIEVWNKADQLDDETRAVLEVRAAGLSPRAFLVSAIAGQGIAELLCEADRLVFRRTRLRTALIAPAEGRIRAWLHQNCDVVEEIAVENGATEIQVYLSEADERRLRKAYPSVSLTAGTFPSP